MNRGSEERDSGVDLMIKCISVARSRVPSPVSGINFYVCKWISCQISDIKSHRCDLQRLPFFMPLIIFIVHRNLLKKWMKTILILFYMPLWLKMALSHRLCSLNFFSTVNMFLSHYGGNLLLKSGLICLDKHSFIEVIPVSCWKLRFLRKSYSYPLPFSYICMVFHLNIVLCRLIRLFILCPVIGRASQRFVSKISLKNTHSYSKRLINSSKHFLRSCKIKLLT